jgi:hypothetical protein
MASIVADRWVHGAPDDGLLTPQSIELPRSGNWSGKKANIEYKLIMITGAFERPGYRFIGPQTL